jgi:hypothetical protein
LPYYRPPSPLYGPIQIRHHHRIDEGIETVIEDERLARAKVEKHRECWPTAFYERDCHGDPIFVDRMGNLGTCVSLKHINASACIAFILAWRDLA